MRRGSTQGKREQEGQDSEHGPGADPSRRGCLEVGFAQWVKKGSNQDRPCEPFREHQKEHQGSEVPVADDHDHLNDAQEQWLQSPHGSEQVEGAIRVRVIAGKYHHIADAIEASILEQEMHQAAEDHHARDQNEPVQGDPAAGVVVVGFTRQDSFQKIYIFLLSTGCR